MTRHVNFFFKFKIALRNYIFRARKFTFFVNLIWWFNGTHNILDNFRIFFNGENLSSMSWVLVKFYQKITSILLKLQKSLQNLSISSWNFFSSQTTINVDDKFLNDFLNAMFGQHKKIINTQTNGRLSPQHHHSIASSSFLSNESATHLIKNRKKEFFTTWNLNFKRFLIFFLSRDEIPH